jgi:hypothetical protein
MLDLELFRLVAANACCVTVIVNKMWPGLQLIRYTLSVFLAVVVELKID